MKVQVELLELRVDSKISLKLPMIGRSSDIFKLFGASNG
jgi:hypothetical protein